MSTNKICELIPLVALFGTTGEDDVCLTPIKCRTVSFASLLARLLRWRDAGLPTHTQWASDVMSCLDLKKICNKVCNLNKKSQKVWTSFLTVSLKTAFFTSFLFVFLYRVYTILSISKFTFLFFLITYLIILIFVTL